MAHPLPSPQIAAARSPAEIPLRSWGRIALATWKDGGEDNLGLVSAGVAFYAFLAFVPLLTIFVLSYGLVAEPASVVRHMRTLTSVMPQNAAGIVGEQLASMTQESGTRTGFALLLALGIAIYGASRGATSIITALNIVFEVEETRTLVRRYLMALVMTVGALLVLFLAILAVSAMNFLETLLPDLGGVSQALLKTVFFLAAGAGVILLLALVYRYGPNRPRAEWQWITPGSALATLVWLAATFGFALYVSNFGSYNATYGSLGAVIVFLTWLYLTAYIVLFGAELNAVLELTVGRERVQEDKKDPRNEDPANASPAALPAREARGAAPSLIGLVTRLGLFSMLLRLLGRSRRARVSR